MRAVWNLGVLVLLAAGCAGTRTGLVPRPRTPLGYDGQPLAVPVAVTASAETVAVTPQRDDDADNGSVIARDHYTVTARLRTGPTTEVAGIIGYAPGANAVSAGPGDPASFDDRSTWGVGASFRVSALGDPESQLRIAFSFDWQLWTLPLDSMSSTSEAILGATIMPSYRRGRFTGFLGLTAGTELSIPYQTSGVGEETSLRFVPLGHAGLRVDVTPGLGIAAHVAGSYGSQGRDVPLLGLSMIIEPTAF